MKQMKQSKQWIKTFDSYVEYRKNMSVFEFMPLEVSINDLREFLLMNDYNSIHIDYILDMLSTDNINDDLKFGILPEWIRIVLLREDYDNALNLAHFLVNHSYLEAEIVEIINDCVINNRHNDNLIRVAYDLLSILGYKREVYDFFQRYYNVLKVGV